MEVEARLLAMRSIRHEDITPGEALPQPDMSIVEPQQDICLSSLMRYVTALGGQLEVRAVFPDETVTLVGADQAVG